ncbi:zinc-binding dehydrogenase [Streptomyces sp. NBC_00554]|uniref:zinc-dependent alcohol dehydrogenase n=1 Tax=Streptomyces sp. NBC_00554 TaxID=2903661 RepID=UPI00352C49EE|nr:zinc-binding dehydrogenase [Streptomyces sp. NBC_00554]
MGDEFTENAEADPPRMLRPGTGHSVLRSQRHADALDGELQGCGSPIGLLAVQVARELGAQVVALIGTRDSRLVIGRKFGADLTVNSREEDAVVAVRGATAGQGADIVLECSGAPSAVNDALHMAKRSGKVVLVGFFDRPVLADLNPAVMNGISIETVRGEGTGSVARAVSPAGRGRLRASELVTHHFALDDVIEAFDTYAERRGDAIKVTLDVSEDTEESRVG